MLRGVSRYKTRPHFPGFEDPHGSDRHGSTRRGRENAIDDIFGSIWRALDLLYFLLLSDSQQTLLKDIKIGFIETEASEEASFGFAKGMCFGE